MGDDCWEADISSRESVQACHRMMVQSDAFRVGAVVNLLGLQEPFAGPGCPTHPDLLPLALGFLHVVQEFADDLKASSKEGGGWVLNVTTLDGRFGCARRRPLAIAQASTLGIAKTLAREYRGLRVKNVDLDPDLDLELRERLVVEELLADDALVEAGHDREGRWTITGVFEQPTNGQLGPLPIDRDSVVLLTGGAGGVTAAVAKELARQAGPRLILVGRSPLPQPEDAATSQHRDKASLRRHLLASCQGSGKDVTPAQIEVRLKRILKDREILENIAAMQAAGSAVEYHSIDVSDSDRFAAFIQEIYRARGRLDGVIHGAGIVEDKLIRDKTSASFSRVFSTKVNGADAIVRSVHSDSLRFLVFFSSVTARLGTAGQVDYAAANEVLNKLADHLSLTWPGRVVAINWGPWRGGMVSEELLRLYAARNIPAIPMVAGARKLLEELRVSRKSTPEVLIVAGDLESLAEAAG